MHKKVHWGIIGLGKIANKFAADLQLSDNAILQGVASRNMNKAIAFAEKHNAVSTFDSYEKLVNDSEIDVIYIATPHTFHFENTLLCLQNGKAVLCEKPMGINSTQVQTMIEEAKSRKLFLMEAIWTRFMPAIEKTLELLDEKTIGDIVQVRADFGFRADFNPENRLFNKKLGGGSLLDIGIYPIFISLLILGIPTDIKAMASMTETDVDSFCAMLFDYSTNAKAVLESTIEANTQTEAYIHGTKGSLKLHRQFHNPSKITLEKDGIETIFELPFTGNGYLHEIEEVNNCLLNGETESSKLPLDLSMNLSNLIDTIKTQIGLNYN